MKFTTAIVAALALLPVVSHATDLSDQVLAEINLARTNPQQYAQIIAAQYPGSGGGAVGEAIHFLEKARPLPALSVSPGMCNSALSHVLESGPVGGRGHKGANGSQPWDRMAQFGRWVGHAGENIDYGVHDARSIVARLIVDDGVAGRGHRKNIFNREFRVAGAASGYHATFGLMCVIDFADGFVEGAGRMAVRTAPSTAWAF
ncbi:MAG TPA: CAP domain-containing protein [Chthoniobacter sp.]